MKKEDLEGLSVNLPRPFGVDYVPRKKRKRPDEAGRVHVGRVADIPPGTAVSVALPNCRVGVFNVNGTFHAVRDACPHAEYPLSKSTIREETVTCASHGWQFNLMTGVCLKGEPGLTLRKFPVEVDESGNLWIHAGTA